MFVHDHLTPRANGNITYEDLAKAKVGIMTVLYTLRSQGRLNLEQNSCQLGTSH